MSFCWVNHKYFLFSDFRRNSHVFSHVLRILCSKEMAYWMLYSGIDSTAEYLNLFRHLKMEIAIIAFNLMCSSGPITVGAFLSKPFFMLVTNSRFCLYRLLLNLWALLILQFFAEIKFSDPAALHFPLSFSFLSWFSSLSFSPALFFPNSLLNTDVCNLPRQFKFPAFLSRDAWSLGLRHKCYPTYHFTENPFSKFQLISLDLVTHPQANVLHFEFGLWKLSNLSNVSQERLRSAAVTNDFIFSVGSTWDQQHFLSYLCIFVITG